MSGLLDALSTNLGKQNEKRHGWCRVFNRNVIVMGNLGGISTTFTAETEAANVVDAKRCNTSGFVPFPAFRPMT